METHLHEVDRDVAIIVVDGGLNHGTAQELTDSAAALVSAGVRKVILDCTRLGVLSSTGMGAILALHGRMRSQGGDVRVAGLGGAAMQALRIMHLDRLFGCYPDVDQARMAFRSTRAPLDPKAGQAPPPGGM